jgi:hypothetical protein
MEPSQFDEALFFRRLADSGARALLIGRRALVLLGLPLLTADYDFWIAIDDIAAFNSVAGEFDLHPTRTPEEARSHGRYALENDEHIDVLVARSVTTIEGQVVAFEELWPRRETVSVAGAEVCLPSIDDLILTKQLRPSPKDLEDVRLLRILKEERS